MITANNYVDILGVSLNSTIFWFLLIVVTFFSGMLDSTFYLISQTIVILKIDLLAGSSMQGNRFRAY